MSLLCLSWPFFKGGQHERAARLGVGCDAHCGRAHRSCVAALDWRPMSVVMDEVRHAEESARVLDLVGRRCVTMSPDRAADLVELSMERACIQGEASWSRGVSSSGLVSVPTTVLKARSERVDALHKRRGAFRPEPGRSRLARLRRGVGFAARCHLAPVAGHRPDTVFMLTLTYAFGVEWKPEHVSDCIRSVRKWLAKSGLPCRFVWVAELQKRGAVHYHVALWLPSDVFLPAPDLVGWWPHGSSRTERARGAVAYLMKYLSKGLGKGDLSLPKGARMFGVGGLDHSMARAKRWLGLPGFVQSRSDIFDDWRPAPGGGWCSPDLVVIPSEFRRLWVGDGYSLVRVEDHGRPFDAAGPFTWLHRGSKWAS